METPEQQAKELETQVEDNNYVVITPTPRQMSVIVGITHDKKILQDRLDDAIKREKDAVNLILDAHNVDPLSAKEVQMQDGKLIVFKNPIEKGSKSTSIPKPGLPQRANGVVEKKQ